MPDTPTPKIGLVRTSLGSKPWKKGQDYNWALLDTLVGGLQDGSVPAGVANTVALSALTALVQSTSGDLTSIGNMADGVLTKVIVDHSADKLFDFPCEPIVACTVSGVDISILANRAISLNSTEYGGKFCITINNQSGGTLAGSTITWVRKGLKFS